MITFLEVQGMRVRLEHTELEKVRATLGGVIGHRGDAGDFVQWLCYHGTDDRGRYALWIESSEIDGPMVGGFHLRRISSTQKLDSRCQVLAGQPKLPLKLGLGISEKQVAAQLGRPTTNRKRLLIYEHEHETKGHGQPYTAMNSVGIEIESEAVAAIEVWKSTTN